ncbi:ankyrin-1 isoform X1 [Lingula anatina]|uniref:Ankyrin-1 isoform X1 n=1 Tax=Lingula anatina TaxID=7574 RepID=A0A1S3ITE9_LINAN|nr:ankyrin-1 isoform X1 [Lingula anatina]XP_013401485.1 ankyrin-1 isoform X2 [Lingula anatina]XP_013401486.1 ankyrin-1 isoform X1 [Lingula anatina]XP_013401487.1 ankyrin-1 isoform X1 [Lingula anatina]|eukprot:XP_013401483.1 ankyrin-1 isoform X1 [Lingula anatina]
MPRIQKSLTQAILEEDVAAVRYMTSSGSDVIVVNDVIPTNEGHVHALHLAAQIGNLDILQYLIDAGANVNAKRTVGSLHDVTPLHYASQCNHPKVVNFLIEAGCDVSARRSDGCTALHLASQGGFTDIVRTLVTCGCDPDVIVSSCEVTGLTSLHLAAQRGHLQVVKALIQAGCDIFKKKSSRDVKDLNALHLAAKGGHSHVVDTLVKAGLDPNVQLNQGHSALYLAAKEGHVNCVRKLLSLGAKLDHLNVNLSPLFIAARKGKVEVIKCLIEHDYFRAKNEALTVVHKKAVATLLRRHPCVLFEEDAKGRALLHWACEKGLVHVVSHVMETEREARFLMERRVTAAGSPYLGLTPAHIAALQGKSDILKLLREFSCKFNAKARLGDIDDVTVLHCVAKSGDAASMVAAIDAKGDINAGDSDGCTPLHWAARYGCILAVDILLQAGADPEIKNRAGLLPYHYALQDGYTDICRKLQHSMNIGGEYADYVNMAQKTKDSFDVTDSAPIPHSRRSCSPDVQQMTTNGKELPEENGQTFRKTTEHAETQRKCSISPSQSNGVCLDVSSNYALTIHPNGDCSTGSSNQTTTNGSPLVRRASSRRHLIRYFQNWISRRRNTGRKGNTDRQILEKICSILKEHIPSRDLPNLAVRLDVPSWVHGGGNGMDIALRAEKMLAYWLRRDVNPTVQRLCEALIRIGRVDLLGIIHLVTDISDVTGSQFDIPESLKEAPLMDLSHEIGQEWKTLGIYLGLSIAEIDHIVHDDQGDMRLQIFNMLLRWRNRSLLSERGPLQRQLCEALVKVNRKDLADALHVTYASPT